MAVIKQHVVEYGQSAGRSVHERSSSLDISSYERARLHQVAIVYSQWIGLR